MKIIEILKSKKPTFSFEFFPPKNPELENILYETIDSLRGKKPDFSSVTFGALGSATDKSIDYTIEIKKRLETNVMMHLTCVGFDNSQLDTILERLKNEGIENILALRGDIPKDNADAVKNRRFIHASDLIDYLAKKGGFSIGAACYPEGHPESKSFDDDIDNLIKKIDNGAEFLVTQLFFDNDKFYTFKNKLAKRGVKIPIIAGIMPIANASQVLKFTATCGATLPYYLVDKIKDKPDDEVAKIGLEFAVGQSNDLITYGADGVHYYTLNRSKTTLSILRELGR